MKENPYNQLPQTFDFHSRHNQDSPKKIIRHQRANTDYMQALHPNETTILPHIENKSYEELSGYANSMIEAEYLLNKNLGNLEYSNIEDFAQKFRFIVNRAKQKNLHELKPYNPTAPQNERKTQLSLRDVELRPDDEYEFNSKEVRLMADIMDKQLINLQKIILEYSADNITEKQRNDFYYKASGALHSRTAVIDLVSVFLGKYTNSGTKHADKSPKPNNSLLNKLKLHTIGKAMQDKRLKLPNQPLQTNRIHPLTETINKIVTAGKNLFK